MPAHRQVACSVLTCRVCCLQVARLHELLKEGIASGEVQPLPWTVFARSKAEDAFRYLASGVRLIFILAYLTI